MLLILSPCNLRLVCVYIGLNKYTYSSLVEEKEEVPGSMGTVVAVLKGMCYSAKIPMAKTVAGNGFRVEF